MNLNGYDLTRAQPIDFDDIREGDTVIGFKRDGVIGFVVPGTDAPYVDAPGDMWYCARDGYTWFLLSRPAPQIEPGTTGTATVRGVPGVRVMRVDAPQPNDEPWVAAKPVANRFWHFADDVEDFVADPAPGLPQDVLDAIADLATADDLAHKSRTVAAAHNLRASAISDFLTIIDEREARDV